MASTQLVMQVGVANTMPVLVTKSRCTARRRHGASVRMSLLYSMKPNMI
jgi:hypothetical protein